MSIILVRHGETLLNAARVFQPPETDLSPRGLGQAKLVAKRIAEFAPVAIISSDMPRAYTTAKSIEQETGLPLTTTTLLHERNFGDWRGQKHEAVGIDPNTFIGNPPGGESSETFNQRVAQAFEKIISLRKSLDGTLVVVSHGLVIQVMLQSCIERNGQPMPARIANTSITVFGMDQPHAVQLINCSRHLEGTEYSEDSKSLSGG